MADGALSLGGAVIVASNELMAIVWVHVIPIFLTAAVVICDIVFVLGCDSLRVLGSRCIIGKNYIEMDARTCDRIRDREGDQCAKQTEGIHYVNCISSIVAVFSSVKRGGEIWKVYMLQY